MRSITRHLSPGLAAVVAVSALGFAGTAAAAPPDLFPFVDTDSSTANPVATSKWFVETTPGPAYSAKLHFGTQIANSAAAGTFKITAGTASGAANARTAVAVQQVDAVGTNLTLVRLVGDALGGSGNYDWRIEGVAKYTLTPTSGPLVNSALGAVCRDDSSNFVTVPPGPAEFSPAVCLVLNNNATGFSSGISPGYQDVIAPSTGNSAYFDVTGVAPGAATFTAIVDPNNEIAESNNANNTLAAGITLPGVTAAASALTTTTTTPVTGQLAASIVAPEFLGQRADQVSPVAAVPGSLTYALATNPANGTAAVTAAGKVTYTARSGFAGADSFTYTATDSRGLRSAPATVTVTVAAAGTTPPSVIGPPLAPGMRLTLKLKPAFSVVRKGGKTFVKVTGTLPTSQAGRLVKIQRKVGKKVTTVATAKIAANGKYTKLVRFSAVKVLIRASIPASKTAKASTSGFKSVKLTR